MDVLETNLRVSDDHICMHEHGTRVLAQVALGPQVVFHDVASAHDDTHCPLEWS